MTRSIWLGGVFVVGEDTEVTEQRPKWALERAELVSAAEDPVETRSAPPPSLTFGILACQEPQATAIAAWSSVNPTGGGAGPLKQD
jgi:hypothetical protein